MDPMMTLSMRAVKNASGQKWQCHFVTIMPKVLYMDFHQEWTGYEICNEKFIQGETTVYTLFGVSKVKFVVETPPILGSLGLY